MASARSLADAKPAEDPVENIIGVDLSDDIPQFVEYDPQFRGNQFFS
jgi:hypothetical protein